MLPLLSLEERETARSDPIDGIDGTVCDVARTPRVRVHDALTTAREDGFETLQEIAVRDLLERLATAGQLFFGRGVPAHSGELPPFERYQRRVVAATGMPAGWVRTAAHWIAFGLRHLSESLRAQSPTGGLEVYDDPGYVRETNVGLAFAPRVRALGATMPANDPTVYVWPVVALAMKIPLVLRPSDRDPFTAIRLGRALRRAGIPASAVHVLPGDRSIGETVCRDADHAMAFGGDAVVDRFRSDPTVSTYGPGESVAVLARDPTDRELETLARGVARSGGRACFCLTRLVATGECDADALATRLADRIVRVDATRCGSLYDERTGVPGFSPRRAEQIDATVGELTGTDVTADRRGGGRDCACDAGRGSDSDSRLLERDGVARLLPTVLRTDELVPELPFQFAGVTRRDVDELPDCLDGAYLGVVIGDDDLERTFVRSPEIRKVYGGRYPAAVDLRETHETYLGSELYETTTYDPG
ncbi:aldehyde dehydrogenase family protein [Natrialbaceae archaeon AArc-T1-2]|uniref:aldehyde dehydrogenase family protein n=1 Tax=Natrialbaceae archaeon AArc-T1-2 TaxID=3053904 RepID=UPI00255A95A2|nr:aldehyde dehydrogenase family protein [Natrialbaceae archaeon AArc-T1-2]WIV65913.1 aldehyde dehydrogenase family protein [Natrialbaceae archaeon AArc-T1-2]